MWWYCFSGTFYLRHLNYQTTTTSPAPGRTTNKTHTTEQVPVLCHVRAQAHFISGSMLRYTLSIRYGTVRGIRALQSLLGMAKWYIQKNIQVANTEQHITARTHEKNINKNTLIRPNGYTKVVLTKEHRWFNRIETETDKSSHRSWSQLINAAIDASSTDMG